MCENDESMLQEKRQLLWRGQIVTVDVFYEMSKGNAVTPFQVSVAENLLFDRFHVLQNLPVCYTRSHLYDMDGGAVLCDMMPASVTIFKEREWHITFVSAKNNRTTIVAKICGLSDTVTVEFSE